jgi:hypothetical protein
VLGCNLLPIACCAVATRLNGLVYPLQELLMDDILGPVGVSPKHKFTVAEGSYVLVAGAGGCGGDA